MTLFLDDLNPTLRATMNHAAGLGLEVFQGVLDHHHAIPEVFCSAETIDDLQGFLDQAARLGTGILIIDIESISRADVDAALDGLELADTDELESRFGRETLRGLELTVGQPGFAAISYILKNSSLMATLALQTKSHQLIEWLIQESLQEESSDDER